MLKHGWTLKTLCQWEAVRKDYILYDFTKRKVQDRQIQRDRMQGWGGGEDEWRVTANVVRVSYWGDEDILESSDSLHNIVNVLSATEVYILKWFCEFHFIKLNWKTWRAEHQHCWLKAISLFDNRLSRRQGWWPQAKDRASQGNDQGILYWHGMCKLLKYFDSMYLSFF